MLIKIAFFFHNNTYQKIMQILTERSEAASILSLLTVKQYLQLCCSADKGKELKGNKGGDAWVLVGLGRLWKDGSQQAK